MLVNLFFGSMTPRGRNNVKSKIGRKEMEKMRKLGFSLSSVLFISVTLLCIVLYSGSPAYAEEPLLCADDIEKFCKEIKPGGGRIMNCLKAHETELTASCREKMSELQGVIQGCEEACAGDIARVCKEVQPGGGRIIKCLREHEKELSSACIILPAMWSMMNMFTSKPTFSTLRLSSSYGLHSQKRSCWPPIRNSSSPS